MCVRTHMHVHTRLFLWIPNDISQLTLEHLFGEDRGKGSERWEVPEITLGNTMNPIYPIPIFTNQLLASFVSSSFLTTFPSVSPMSF